MEEKANGDEMVRGMAKGEKWRDRGGGEERVLYFRSPSLPLFSFALLTTSAKDKMQLSQKIGRMKSDHLCLAFRSLFFMDLLANSF